MSFVIPTPRIPEMPLFVHSKCCGRCPTTKGLDPESEDILTYDQEVRMKDFTFACAWRPEGYCRGNYLQNYFGKPYNELEIK